MVLGIDPGFTGAIATISREGTVNILDMPTSAGSSKILTSRDIEIDARSLYNWLERHAGDTNLAVLEKVMAMPEQGLSSTFRFGEGYGVIQGVLAALNVRVVRVIPSVWKPSMSVTKDKSTSLELAIRLYPQCAHLLSRKKDHGRAEALLLAHYGKRILGWTESGETINDIL